jgi:tripartite-type tricarboxylate transporter receptor subunit TctC
MYERDNSTNAFGLMDRIIPIRQACLALALLATLASAAKAEQDEWPNRPVKIVVPFGAGGNTDIIARIVAQDFSGAFGQSFIVENRPGAAGVLGAEAVARAPADGYTLLMATQPQISIVPAMTKTTYDPVKDFVPISNIGTNPFVLVVRPGLPASTVAEFVDYVRANPNKLTYVATGVGSVNHLAMTLLLNRAGLSMTPVMYKGGPAGLTDVIAGRVDAYFAGISVAAPHMARADLKLLAVTSDTRAPQIPLVPTLAESGFPGFKILLWTGLLAPAGTAQGTIDRIATEVARLVRDPATAQRLTSNGVDLLGNNPKEFAAMIGEDIVLWTEALKIAGLRAR